MCFGDYAFEITTISPRGQCFNILTILWHVTWWGWQTAYHPRRELRSFGYVIMAGGIGLKRVCFLSLGKITANVRRYIIFYPVSRWFETLLPASVMIHTVYPKKYAHGFVVLCFVVVMQSFIMNSHEVFIHIHEGCFAGTGAIVRLPQCQWSKPYGYGKISQCITTTKHSKAKTVCIFLGIYCRI